MGIHPVARARDQAPAGAARPGSGAADRARRLARAHRMESSWWRSAAAGALSRPILPLPPPPWRPACAGMGASFQADEGRTRSGKVRRNGPRAARRAAVWRRLGAGSARGCCVWGERCRATAPKDVLRTRGGFRRHTSRQAVARRRHLINRAGLVVCESLCRALARATLAQSAKAVGGRLRPRLAASGLRPRPQSRPRRLRCSSACPNVAWTMLRLHPHSLLLASRYFPRPRTRRSP